MEVALKKHLMQCETWPLVFDNVLSLCQATAWTPGVLAKILDQKQLKFRIGEKERTNVQWETECKYVLASIDDFIKWQDGEVKESNPFDAFSRDTHWAYLDYKYMVDIFPSDQLQAIDWSALGFDGRDGKESTLWLGSTGAYTVGHYDTYGCNLVAQIFGRKQWVLFPPTETSNLYPTRLPYEESSVFSQVHLAQPDIEKHPKFKKTRGCVVTLHPGQVLYVPRHWWHFVTNLETSISINSWIEMAADDESRLTEAVTQLLVFSLMRADAEKHLQDERLVWLNPTQEYSEGSASQLNYINQSLQQLKEASDSEPETSGKPENKFSQWTSDNEGSPIKKLKLDTNAGLQCMCGLDQSKMYAKCTRLSPVCHKRLMELLSVLDHSSVDSPDQSNINKRKAEADDSGKSQNNEPFDGCSKAAKVDKLSISDVVNCILDPEVIDLVSTKLKKKMLDK